MLPRIQCSVIPVPEINHSGDCQDRSCELFDIFPRPSIFAEICSLNELIRLGYADPREIIRKKAYRPLSIILNPLYVSRYRCEIREGPGVQNS